MNFDNLKQVLKNNANIDLCDDKGDRKHLLIILDELSSKWNELTEENKKEINAVFLTMQK